MTAGFLVAATAVASLLLTGAIRRYLVANGVVDFPNERSSHAAPVPRGGGVAIAGTILGGLVAARALGWVDLWIAIGLGVGVAAVALVGWLDDRRGVPPPARLAVHALAAGWAVFWVGGLGGDGPGLAGFLARPAEAAIAIVAIVWLTNLYNFMDGIDGLAAVEAVQVAGFAAMAALLIGDLPVAIVCFLVGAASVGFLWWNRPPARVFMGDVGSGTLGYVFGVLALASARSGGLSLAVWAILLGVFIFDATVTLIRRVRAGARWDEAHRSHAYQRLAQRVGHRRVTWGVAVLNVVLGAVAVGAVLGPRWELAAAGTAAGLLAVCYALTERVAPMAR